MKICFIIEVIYIQLDLQTQHIYFNSKIWTFNFPNEQIFYQTWKMFPIKISNGNKSSVHNAKLIPQIYTNRQRLDHVFNLPKPRCFWRGLRFELHRQDSTVWTLLVWDRRRPTTQMADKTILWATYGLRERKVVQGAGTWVGMGFCGRFRF